ncbi:hypothetical protein R5L02_21015, partial [Acinetobacter baumannii]|uniref:hypothetical protein n=1 Tax=Acinetobacter baumannii TaxID=470 RepID=UPI002954B4C2
LGYELGLTVVSFGLHWVAKVKLSLVKTATTLVHLALLNPGDTVLGYELGLTVVSFGLHWVAKVKLSLVKTATTLV